MLYIIFFYILLSVKDIRNFVFSIVHRRILRIMKTFMARPQDMQRKWYIVDAEDKILGRLATRIADTLRGKKKAIFTPSVDTGDFVIVINAEKIRLSGKKSDKKLYQSHSLYPGGFKEQEFKHVLATRPEKIIKDAVRGMLPKTKLGDRVFKKIRVYKGSTHPHTSVVLEPLK
jgi:large subunit ribosomal protein L13